MSILSVHDLQGISAYSNTIRVPTGHNLETYGNLVANGTLKVPTWTTTGRPATPATGMIGYNTTLKVTEIYTGSEKGWVSIGTSASLSLAESVGVTPVIHYQSADLSTMSDGTTLNSSNQWKNNGSYGTNYNLINDTSGYYSTSITVTTQSGKKAANFSGFCALAFANAAYFNIYTANASPLWSVSYVYGGGTSSTGSDYSPSFCGHAQGPITNIPDRIGGGLFGWGFSTTWGGNGALQHWYDNDGASNAGTPGGSNSVINQWVNVVSGSSTPQQKSWKGKTSSPFLSGNIDGISIGAGPTYGFNIPISGMGNTRRADTSAYTCTGYLLDAALWNVALTDGQVSSLRNYYASVYPVGDVAS
jgi:hypothetical protein